LRIAICDRRRNSAQRKTPTGFGEGFQDKAPGGDLLRIAIYDRRRNSAQRKTPTGFGEGFQDKAPGGDLLLHDRATLPSAHARFTSEFGMGSGGTTPLWPPGKGWEQRASAGSTFFLKSSVVNIADQTLP
jgi:hypothetical protein